MIRGMDRRRFIVTLAGMLTFRGLAQIALDNAELIDFQSKAFQLAEAGNFPVRGVVRQNHDPAH